VKEKTSCWSRVSNQCTIYIQDSKFFSDYPERSHQVFLGGRVLTAVVKHELLLLLQVNLTVGTLKLFAETGFWL